MDAAVTLASRTADATWHTVSAGEVLKRLHTTTQSGLDDTEIASRLAKYGPNRLPSARRQSPLARFLQQFNNVLVYVLLGAGFIKLMMSLWLDASIIFGVVVLNGLLGFVQEGKAERSLEFDP